MRGKVGVAAQNLVRGMLIEGNIGQQTQRRGGAAQNLARGMLIEGSIGRQTRRSGDDCPKSSPRDAN